MDILSTLLGYLYNPTICLFHIADAVQTKGGVGGTELVLIQSVTLSLFF